MGTCFQSTLLTLLAVCLTFAGVGPGSFSSATHAVSAGKGKDHFQASYFQSEQLAFDFLHRGSETVVSPVDYQPAPNIKASRIACLSMQASIENSILSKITQYLFYARDICCSLAGSDIIFPFHYFW